MWSTQAMVPFREQNVQCSRATTQWLFGPKNESERERERQPTQDMSINNRYYIHTYISIVDIPKGMICLCCSFPAYHFWCVLGKRITMRGKNNRKYLVLSCSFVLFFRFILCGWFYDIFFQLLSHSHSHSFFSCLLFHATFCVIFPRLLANVKMCNFLFLRICVT